MTRLVGRRILVVGASSGIGLATGVALAAEGARVALCARRLEQLRVEAAKLGDGHIAVECDVRDPDACARAVESAAERLGGLTDLVYTAGAATLGRVADATASQWRESFEINVVGPSLIISAALPHLSKNRGRAIIVSSVAAEDRPPRRGLAVYSTSKAALNRLIECWETEERSVSFTRVAVGDTHGTEMAKGWEGETTGKYAREWVEEGYLRGRTMSPRAVAQHLVDLVASQETVAVSSIIPRYPDEA